MSRQPSTYAAPISPVTPIWASNPDYRATQRQQLLPSAIEMNTPPQTVPRKLPAAPHLSHLPTMPSFSEAMNATNTHSSVQSEVDTINGSIRVSEAQMVPSLNGVNSNAGAFGSSESSDAAHYAIIDSHGVPFQSVASPQTFVSHNGQFTLPSHRQNAASSQLTSESYPSMQASYQQYYPQSVNRRAHPGSSMSNYNPGRVVKGSARVVLNSQRPAQMFSPQNTQNTHAQFGNGLLPNGLNNTADMQQSFPTIMAPGLPQKIVNMRQNMPQAMHRGVQMAMPGYSDPRATRIPQSVGSFADGGIPSRKDRYAAYNHYILRHAAEEKSKVIWPPEVEAAFMEAVWLIPGDSCKIQMERRTRGRNELISDYLKHQLNETRSRKQVSSHLQVLKKLLRDDEEFLECVGPKKGESQESAYENKQDPSKMRPDMAASTLTQLINKLKAAKQGHRKPAFLLQAESNLQQSRLEDNENRMDASITRSVNINYGDGDTHLPSHVFPNMPKINSESQNSSAAQLVKSEIAAGSSRDIAPSYVPYHMVSTVRNTADIDQSPLNKHQEHGAKEPPLRHPRPVHAQDVNTFAFDPVVPSASVPPNEVLNVKSSPRQQLRHHRRHPSRHHRRTTSTSVDLSGDRVLPIQFDMRRVHGDETVTYSRLLRATYESPMRPLQLDHLTSKFAELSKQQSENLLVGTQIVHANVALYIKSNPELDIQTIREHYSSDVQFVVTADAASTQHRYIVKTVVASRASELLRCEMPCMYQRLAGRGLELDKDLVNVPFLPDFWSDFLARLNNSEHEYVETALTALTLQQSIYRVANDTEELCFVSLYQFSIAHDEFSARTRFRRVKGMSSASGQQATQRVPGPSDKSPHASSTQRIPAIREPSTPTRSGNSSQRALEQTPKITNTPNLLGIGTPGQAVGSLGALINYDSPSAFTSPRRMATLDSIDLGASPFTAAIGNDPRHSPRSAKFEIQRAMTAFEPSAWDEMHDWIYQ